MYKNNTFTEKIDEEYLAFYDIGLDKGGRCLPDTAVQVEFELNFLTVKLQSPLSL